jgi:hypothetical protein
MVLVVPPEHAGSVQMVAGMPVHRIGRVVAQTGPERVVLR